ncbi:unnamed protein product [Ilex paraguariensis]|uniref:Uncharacterized protein n=1 Tax=Ilex paraguariensis TaxID=185542 RepID=A0ABC8S2R4_9AQUA
MGADCWALALETPNKETPMREELALFGGSALSTMSTEKALLRVALGNTSSRLGEALLSLGDSAWALAGTGISTGLGNTREA